MVNGILGVGCHPLVADKTVIYLSCFSDFLPEFALPLLYEINLFLKRILIWRQEESSVTIGAYVHLCCGQFLENDDTRYKIQIYFPKSTLH